MSADNSGEQAREPFELFYPLVERYAPRYRALAGNLGLDADDLKQEILIKFLKRFKTVADWHGVTNKTAYLLRAAKNVAFTMRKRLPVKHDSLDDEENDKLRNILSDDGNSCSQINTKIDLAETHIQINKMLEEFSEYERLLIQLHINEGCKPNHVANLVVEEYFATLQKAYPSLTLGNTSEFKNTIKIDCNAAAAKFRQKLKKKISDGGEESR